MEDLPTSGSPPDSDESDTSDRESTESIEQAPTFGREQAAEWQRRLDESRHPSMLLNWRFEPVLLNRSLEDKLKALPISLSDVQSTTLHWYDVCQKIAAVVANLADNCEDGVLATTLQVGNLNIAVVGSLVEHADGTVMGAVLHLAEIVTESIEQQEHERADVEPESSDEYRTWLLRRQYARRRMARLSPREAQIVSLVTDGLPNKIIADRLRVSTKTVEKHRAGATRKLGVSCAAEVVRIATIADHPPSGKSVDDD